MNKRTSIRSFNTEDLSSDLLDKMKVIIIKKRSGPFGSRHNFSLIDINEKKLNELGKMTSYGVVKGARYYFAGYCDPDDRSLIDFGYCFQEVVLELTELGLGTCWLGGTFGRSFIAKALSLPDGKVIPAISPVGLPLGKRTTTDKLVRYIAKSSNRKSHDQLFFNHYGSEGVKPIGAEVENGPLSKILEGVRFAPSASNKQPWRFIFKEDHIHLYWDFNEKYNAAFKSFNIQALDMGIALCHLIKSTDELELMAGFIDEDPQFESIPWKYVASLKNKVVV
ncbi:MAG: nitroreductase family protein [Spirochaetales bacterium]|nr:nitroreductase family protein [Spirochaetales bacterium]